MSSGPNSHGAIPSLFRYAAGHSHLHNGFSGTPTRSRTPINAHAIPSTIPESDQQEIDPRSLRFKEIYDKTESKIEDVLAGRLKRKRNEVESAAVDSANLAGEIGTKVTEESEPSGQPPRTRRKIDEDDYDDSEEEEEEITEQKPPSPAKTNASLPSSIPHPASPAPKSHSSVHGLSTPLRGQQTSKDRAAAATDARQKLEEDRKAKEEEAKASFNTMFYTLDNDAEAMEEQQRLEESERQLEEEMGNNNPANGSAALGTLSQANLGASSLALKHLIARIDRHRERVIASDSDIRGLLIEVRKNRSKWASEDRIGQEELYEAAEKVLGEIKAMTPHSAPFLQKVNKREAPDYAHIIKNPMDLSQITKKLKQLTYKSRREFVDDLNLIWSNCLRYNSNPDHPLRKHANFLKRETEKLIPLIPDITIKDRAEQEAEDRKALAAERVHEKSDDSDDEPIISSRGRKAPSKAKKGIAPRPTTETNGVEEKPASDVQITVLESEKADSDHAGEHLSNGIATPPIANGGLGAIRDIPRSSSVGQSDLMDVDTDSLAGGPIGVQLEQEVDFDTPEEKVYKTVTKKDRAQVSQERTRLYKNDKLNLEEPAILRSKAGMRKWARNRETTQAPAEFETAATNKTDSRTQTANIGAGKAMLGDDLDATEERVLPDFYDPVSTIPDIAPHMLWNTDLEGNVVQPLEDCLRKYPKEMFKTVPSQYSSKLAAQTRQMQETRRVSARIGVVKQMAMQTGVYQGNLPKIEPRSIIETEAEQAVVTDDSGFLAGSVVRSALRRSVARMFYAAGFEECQPMAIEAATDIANDYFSKLTGTLKSFIGHPRVPRVATDGQVHYGMKYSWEESILSTLKENGVELETLESYVTDDADKYSSKLGTLHERMKAHLADLLRPALASDAGPDGVNAFKDGSEQFVGGDFAEDLGEDYFGFRELGLDIEFGMASLAVPLHLLQSRLTMNNQSQTADASATQETLFPTPPPFVPITLENIGNEIGLIQEYFRAKIQENIAKGLIEDENLPMKQRMPKPRLPPNGKITSPRKKPVREVGPGKGHPKKKMRQVDGVWMKEADYVEMMRKKGLEPAAKGQEHLTPTKIKLKPTTSTLSRIETRDDNDDNDDDADGDADADADGDADTDIFGDSPEKKVRFKSRNESIDVAAMSPDSLDV